MEGFFVTVHSLYRGENLRRITFWPIPAANTRLPLRLVLYMPFEFVLRIEGECTAIVLTSKVVVSGRDIL